MQLMGFFGRAAFLSSLAAAMFAVACGGCLHRTHLPPPVLGTAPEPATVVTNKPPPLTESGFYAACSQETQGAHVGPWTGPLRADRNEALKDAQEHIRANPGHRAHVLEY